MAKREPIPDWLRRQFEAGEVPGDEPPGLTERAYQRWKADGGEVKPYTIWKFEFEAADEVVLDMPQGARVIAAGTQRPGHICLWAVVDPQAKPAAQHFLVCGTGQPLRPQRAKHHLGTVFDGPFVWHVFQGV